MSAFHQGSQGRSSTTVAATGGAARRSFSPKSLLLVVLLAGALLPTNVRSDGFQSGPSPGPFYAGGMFFDEANEILYMAGLHYNTDIDDFLFQGTATDTQGSCYVALLDMTDGGQFDAFDDWTSLGKAGILETCSSVAVHDPSQIVLVGSVEPGGELANANSSIPLAGFMAVLGKNDLSLLTGLSLTTDSEPARKLLYPMAAVNDGGDNVYIVALTSTDAEVQPGSEEAYPNWQEVQKYGNSLDMTVIKVTLTQASVDGTPTGDITVDEMWTQEFPIDPEMDGTVPRVYIGGLIYKRDKDGREIIAIAGSTRGKGNGYGPADGNDEDGFIALLDPASGGLYEGITNNIREGSAQDDIVTGICDDPNDPGSFYIVGATKGTIGDQQGGSELLSGVPEGSLQPFIRQVSVNGLSAVWTKQWAALPPSGSATSSSAFASDCYVSGDYVYVAGTVYGGSSMLQGSDVKPSQGGDDVWIARMDRAAGTVEWLTQLGSDGDDKLALYGGVIVNKQGNPMIYGDTTGSLYRQRDGTGDTAADMFVMSLDATTGSRLASDADFLGGSSNEDAAAPVAAPVAAPTVPTAPVAEPVGTPVRPPAEHVFTAIGLQITGPGYAGGIVYDDIQNSVLLSGAHFSSSSSNCFTGVVNLDNGDLEGRRSYGSESLNDGCSAIAFDSLENVAYAVGGSEHGDGDFNDGGSWEEAISDAAQSGIILQMNARAEVIGGNRIGDVAAVYPIAVATHPILNCIYVASMASDSPIANDAAASSRYPDFTGGGPKMYGSNFFLLVNKYSVESFPTEVSPVGSVPTTVERSWEQRYNTTSGTLEVSGMTLAGNGNTLVVVGSTRDGGGPFEENDGTDDMDGWILKLNPDTGGLFISENGSGRSSTRLDSVNMKDDWIFNVCNDRFDHDAFYVVGASMGKVRDLGDDEQPPEGSVHAFVAKVDLEELGALWLQHFIMTIPGGGPVTAKALACTVTPDFEGENIVYVAGTVQNGALMNGVTDITASHGKDDLFIASMDGSSGSLNWIQQIGTSENDQLAAGHGIDVDAYGNAIVYGQTTGSFYSSHDGDGDTTDLVLFTVNKIDGSYLAPKTEGDGVGNDEAIEPPASGPTGSDGVIPDSVVAMQSGPDVGPSYAGGMVYDAYTNAVYMTGSTYGSFAGPGVVPQQTSQCFFGVAFLPKLFWEERSVFGTQDAPEACNALSLTNYQGRSEALLVGSTEPGGLLTGLASRGDAEQYGIILDLSNERGKYELLGGSAIDANQVQFPIEILTNEEKVFVVSMTSGDTKVTADFETVENDEYPNFTTGGVEKYGSRYSILVERHSITRGEDSNAEVLDTTMTLDWRVPFETADTNAIYVSGMVLADGGDTLVIVGSTLSVGGGTDLDGIMAKVGTADGSFFAENDGARSVAYFSSLSGLDDWILNACPDPDDVNAFYIVGATQGTFDAAVDKSAGDPTVHAVVAKIQTDTLAILWSKQFSVSQASTSSTPGAAMALGCAVIPGRSRIYVAGNVEGGAVIDNPSDSQKSAGKDDIFVSLLETNDGSVVWMKQVGSNGDDRLARGGCVIADENGNAVIFGDTTGDLFRSTSKDPNPSYSDLFLMVFNQGDGGHIRPGSGWYGSQDPPPSYSDPSYLAFGITVIVLLVVFIFCVLLVRRRRRKRAESQKSSIFAYLQQFDVEDIDLRKSPPGGWHGTYLNKLAYGINKAEIDGRLPQSDGVTLFETAPLTHSSIVKDSLFMDNMSSPSLGNRAGKDDYGLTSASPYDDLSPRSYDEKRSSLKGREFI